MKDDLYDTVLRLYVTVFFMICENLKVSEIRYIFTKKKESSKLADQCY